jgi:hypothetical protein
VRVPTKKKWRATINNCPPQAIGPEQFTVARIIASGAMRSQADSVDFDHNTQISEIREADALLKLGGKTAISGLHPFGRFSVLHAESSICPSPQSRRVVQRYLPNVTGLTRLNSACGEEIASDPLAALQHAL